VIFQPGGFLMTYATASTCCRTSACWRAEINGSRLMTAALSEVAVEVGELNDEAAPDVRLVELAGLHQAGDVSGATPTRLAASLMEAHFEGMALTLGACIAVPRVQVNGIRGHMQPSVQERTGVPRGPVGCPRCCSVCAIENGCSKALLDFPVLTAPELSRSTRIEAMVNKPLTGL
jgi:hypothetical protein